MAVEVGVGAELAAAAAGEEGEGDGSGGGDVDRVELARGQGKLDRAVRAGKDVLADPAPLVADDERRPGTRREAEAVDVVGAGRVLWTSRAPLYGRMRAASRWA